MDRRLRQLIRSLRSGRKDRRLGWLCGLDIALLRLICLSITWLDGSLGRLGWNLAILGYRRRLGVWLLLWLDSWSKALLVSSCHGRVILLVGCWRCTRSGRIGLLERRRRRWVLLLGRLLHWRLLLHRCRLLSLRQRPVTLLERRRCRWVLLLGGSLGGQLRRTVLGLGRS